jgi:hypothetical protein
MWPTHHLLLQNLDFISLNESKSPQLELDDILSRFGKTRALLVLPAHAAAAVDYTSDDSAKNVSNTPSLLCCFAMRSRLLQ